MKKVIVIGASGQIGTELVVELRSRFGNENIIASDIKDEVGEALQAGPYEKLDIMDDAELRRIVEKHQITEIYLLAALLSATAEKHPDFAWRLNMEGLFNVLNLAKEGTIKKVFWPSSIAVFGSNTPRINTPQYTIMELQRFMGLVSWLVKDGVNIMPSNLEWMSAVSVYPGLISYTSLPGGGTTDYAVDIFYRLKRTRNTPVFFLKKRPYP